MYDEGLHSIGGGGSISIGGNTKDTKNVADLSLFLLQLYIARFKLD